jgi:hypothetical protein
MRLFLVLVCFAAPAHADLYRWIDPETGSVKLSSIPPSDPSISAEIVPYKAPTLPKPPAAPVETRPAGTPTTLDALQSRWSQILTQLTGITPQDFARGGEGLKQQVQAYEAVRAELDRLDPAGAARRQAETVSILDRLKQGFAAQFSTVPPGQQK